MRFTIKEGDESAMNFRGKNVKPEQLSEYLINVHMALELRGSPIMHPGE
jgi:hypothetical protein